MAAWVTVIRPLAALCLLLAADWTNRAVVDAQHEKQQYKELVKEMFLHAYNSYMSHAYPEDELMPLSCRGRRRELENRGDVDDVLGKFSLTLIDTLDTLAVFGLLDEFSNALKAVIRDVKVNNDVVVSVFETNIRVLGGLLGAHFTAVDLQRQGHPQLAWYKGELVAMADEVGRRLLPAFNSTTGLPHPRINLLHGLNMPMAKITDESSTCTACAGTMLLEMAALSRVTGNPEYEAKARHAMEAIWQNRDTEHHLVGTTINIHNGQWMRKDSGVGAGIDSYYEYCLKSYILLGDDEFLERFSKHYEAIMKYISNGPLLVDVNMNSPGKISKNFMDSLLAFWPGLQVLWGDIAPAIDTHEMLYHVTQEHNFLPEAFTLDFKVHWGNHPLRPEFIESTYLLYKATGDPYYLDVGKTVVDSLQRYARVPCGFAALKDLRTNTHEDRMDSYVLAETFKYLYLLFAEEEDLLLDIDHYLFTTEAHLLPLTLALVKPTSAQTANKKQAPRLPPHLLRCPKLFRPYSHYDAYEKLLLKQCTSARFKLLPQLKKSKSERPPRLSLNTLDFSSEDHIATLRDLGIMVEAISGGKIQVSHMMQRARSPEDAEEGWLLMQEIMKVMASQQNPTEGHSVNSDPVAVKVLSPVLEKNEFVVGPAMFGPHLGGNNEFHISAALTEPEPQNGCNQFSNGADITGKIVLLTRGGCLFVQKVRNAEKSGASGVIVADNVDYSTTNATRPFSMSGDGVNDVHIPSVFMQQADANVLRKALASQPVRVMLTGAGVKPGTQTPTAKDAEGLQSDPVSAPTEGISGHGPNSVSAPAEGISSHDPNSVSASTEGISGHGDSHTADMAQNLGTSHP